MKHTTSLGRLEGAKQTGFGKLSRRIFTKVLHSPSPLPVKLEYAMQPKVRLLIVEDESAILNGLIDVFVFHGYEVEGITEGKTGLEKALSGRFDLILLDVMLPGVNGFEICDRVRAADPDQPIIMLTAKSSDEDIIQGLSLGADDYVAKPFSVAQLVLRVKAVLRRACLEPAGQQLAAGPISLNAETREATVNGNLLVLTPSEFKLLQVFMTSINRVFSRDELIQRVQGYEFEGYDRTIDSHIKNLRKKITQYLPDHDVISTVYGVGYRFSTPPG